MLSIVGRVAARGLRALGDGGHELLRVEVHALAGGADEAVARAARVLGDDRAARGDVDRDRLLGLVVDRRVDRAVVLALERHVLARPQLAHQPHGLAQPGEALLELRPLPPGHRDLVERLAGADAEHHPSGVEQPEAGERLRQHRGVVAEGRGQHGGAELDPRRALPHRRDPRHRRRGVPALVPPRQEVVGHHRAVQPHLLGAHGVLDQLTRPELLRRRLVSDPQRHGLPACPDSAVRTKLGCPCHASAPTVLGAMSEALTRRRSALRPTPARAASSAALRPPAPRRPDRQRCRRARRHPRGAGDPARHPRDRRRPGRARRLDTLPWLVLGVLAFGARRGRADPAAQAAGRAPANQVEATMRADLYAHLQRLPVAFHDRWASGQLLSRATSDLTTIRWFVDVLGDLPGGERAHGGRRRGGAGVALAVARAGDRGHGGPAHGHHAGAGAPLLARRPPGPGPGGRPRHRRRGIGARHPGAEVAGPRAAPHGPVRRRRPRPARHGADEGAAARGAVDGRGAGAGGRDRGHPRAGRLRRRRRHAHARHAGRRGHRRHVPVLAGGVARLAAGRGEQRGGRHRALSARCATSRPRSPTRRGRWRWGPVRGELVLEGVRFRYPGAERETLRGVDLVVRPGETMALVGATGSGKTTLTALVPRLYDVTGGPGADRRRRRPRPRAGRAAPGGRHRVRGPGAVLRQRPGERGAGPGRGARRRGAGRRCGWRSADGFVAALPWGLDTRIGEQGLSLSGGQRQRLALARAVLGRPPVLVLDDPLSALDVHTEAEVEAALRRVLGGVTALVVAHRPSTVQLADRVAMLATAGSRPSAPTASCWRPTRSTGRCWRATDQEVAGGDRRDDRDRSTTAGAASRTRTTSDVRPGGHRAAPAGARPAAARRAHPAAPARGGGGVAAARRRRALAELAGPLLVAYAIDTGIPAAVAGDAAPLVWAIAGYAGTAAGVGRAARGLPAADRADRAGRAARRCGGGCSRTASASRSTSTSATPPAG